MPNLLDHERTYALMAPTYTRACSAPVRTLPAQDQAVSQRMIPVPDTLSMGCVANPDHERAVRAT